MVLSQSAALHDVTSRRAASRALAATSPTGPNAEAADYPSVRAPWGCPRRTAFPTLSLCAMCSRPPHRPPNGVAAVHASRRPWLAIGRRASPPIPPYSGHAAVHAMTWFPWYARKPPSPPCARSGFSRGRRRTAIDELCSPRDPRANQPPHPFPLAPVKLPVPHVDPFRPCPHRNSSARGHATTGPPPPLTGDIFGQSTATHRSRVSPIANPLACLPPLASPRRRRAHLRCRVQR
jgi:hypothetical protein